MRVRERVPCRNTAGVLVVHLVRPLRGQISGVLWTQEMNVGVLEPSDVRSFAWYSSQTAISTFENHHTTAYIWTWGGNITFVFETAKTSGAVIGGATRVLSTVVVYRN